MTEPDHALPLPAVPARWEAPGPLDSELRRIPVPGQDADWAVVGRRVWVAGGMLHGADAVWSLPVRVAVGPRLAEAEPEAAIATPLGIERRLRTGGITLVERVVAHPELPAALFEWAAADGPATVRLEWWTDPRPAGASTAAPPRWNADARGLVVDDGAGRRVAFVFERPPEALEVEPARPPDGAGPPGLRVRVRGTVTADQGFLLAVAGPDGADAVERALRAVRRGAVVTTGRRGRLDRLEADRLVLRSPDPALDRAIEREAARLDERLIDAPGGGRVLAVGPDPEPHSVRSADAVAGALDSLLLGGFDAARDVLGFLGRRQDPDGRVPAAASLTGGPPAAGDVEPTLRYLLLAGRYLAWTGDVATVAAAWPRLRVAWAGVADAPAPDGSDAGIRRDALRGLIHAAEAVGDAAALDRLREQSSAEASGGRAPSAEAAGPSVAAAAASAAEPATSAAPAEPGGAVRRLRALLGADPEAVRGRLVLRPRPPALWPGFEVRGLAIGDAAVDLDYERAGAVHTLRVRQTRGAVPLRLILEPELEGALRSARVDGEPAELEPRVAGDRSRVPVQLALDHERTLELEMDARPLVPPAPTV